MTPDWSAAPEAVPYADLSDPQTLNLYAYAENNPVTRTDADGHTPIDWIWQISGHMMQAVGFAFHLWTGQPEGQSGNCGNPCNVTSTAPALSPCFGGDAMCNGAGRVVAEVGLKEDTAVDFGAIGAARGLAGGVAALFDGLSADELEATTINEIVNDAAAPAKGDGTITKAARALDKKLGRASSRGTPTAFSGLQRSDAVQLVEDILSSPARISRGAQSVDVYNAAGQGVRFNATTKEFMGLLEDSQATR